MTGFEYGNTRLRFMKSRLLSRKELDALVQSGNLQGVIMVLMRTGYRKSVGTALARSTNLDCLSDATHMELLETLGKIRNFYHARPGELVALVLGKYDIHNIKAILRGVSRNVPANEILATLIPVGGIAEPALAELANVHDLRSAIDLMVGMNLPGSVSLLALHQTRGVVDLFPIELALEIAYVRNTLQYLRRNPRGSRCLAEAITIHSDVTNLLTIMRFAHSPAERGLLRERLGSEDLERLLIGPGHLSFDLLMQAARQNSLEAAINTFSGTPYADELRAGLQVHEKFGRLGGIEKKLQRYQQNKLAGLIRKDPLGIGVVLGFIALKLNEVNNLRWIAHGINMGLKPDAIRAELEFLE